LSASLNVAGAYLRTAFRERITLFWLFAFPVFLLVLLFLIFGGDLEDREMTFRLGLVNLDLEGDAYGGFAGTVEELFLELAAPHEPGRAPLFILSRPEPDDDREAFLEAEREALRLGQRAAVVVLPEGFSQAVSERLRSPSPDIVPVDVLYSKGRSGSELATTLVEQIIARLNRSLLSAAGLFDETRMVPKEERLTGVQDRAVRYVDFLLPGIVMMAFFTAGLFGVPGTILFNRDRRILRRYWVTPLNVSRYLAGFALGHVGLCALQLGLLWALGAGLLGASSPFGRPGGLLYLGLASATFLAFGFLIASMSRTANAAMAIAQLINVPMLFLGGLFFPVGELPGVLTALVHANPISYLADGLRASLNVGTREFPFWASVGVPILWIAFCVAVTRRRLQWDVER